MSGRFQQRVLVIYLGSGGAGIGRQVDALEVEHAGRPGFPARRDPHQGRRWLAAEVRWSLLPPLTFACREVTQRLDVISAETAASPVPERSGTSGAVLSAPHPST